MLLRELLSFCAGAASSAVFWHGVPWPTSSSQPLSVPFELPNHSHDAPAPTPDEPIPPKEPPAVRPGSFKLADFIDQLERLTVRDTWAGQVMGEVSYYRLNGGYFGNKADFATSFQIMSWYAKQGRCDGSGRENALVLLAGANRGQSTGNVLSACPNARMHIFEILPKLFENHQKRFKDSALVKVHRRGWSDKIATFQITIPASESELAGLFAPFGKWKNAPQLNDTVETVPLADFVVEQGISPPVSYVLIDVEGKEPNVIRGMRLETNRPMFPLFQYELGGTWTDGRHDVDQWGQYGIAMYLKALGYSLYLTGADGGEGSKKPILLKVSPEFFRIACSRPEIDVHGNLLAVHPTLVDPGMWEHLQKFVMVPKPQFQ